MRNIAILLFTGFLGTNIQGHERASIYHTDLPQIYKNEVQTSRYVIKINPLYSESLAQEAKNNGYNLPSKESLKNNSFNIDQKELERPATRYVADKIAATVSKKPIKITSWVANEFIMELSENEAKIISSQKGVSSVEKIKAARINVTLSSTIAEGDIFSGSEIIPWWKTYTNTNDLMNFGVNSPPIYVIDGPMAPPISPEVNLALNYNLTHVPNTNLWLYWHAAHVNGVIGSKNNNNQIRGINPNHPIMHYGTGLLDHQIIDALNSIVAHAEITGTWGSLNISMNALDADENIFEFNNPVGRALAIASNNNLILQSAGNDDSSNACNKGYSFDNSIAYPWDGIMLIGGIERSGDRATSDQVRFHNSGALKYVDASNYGPCVELWAPSKQITSIRFKTNQTQVLSGTSFAAPITAAISARYGSNTTRPLEREWFIKNSSRHTGYYAAGIPIKSVHWKNNQTNTLTRHIIRSIWSPQNNNNINMLYDGAYQSAWNAGTNSGRIIIDLGEEKGVKFIRVTPRSSVPLQNNSPIYFSIAPTNSSNGSHATGPIQTFSQHKHGDRAPITIPLNNMHTRYIILNGHNYGSWLAYSEIEVYGQ